MTFTEFEAQALSLSPAEKARLVQLLLPEITHAFPGIEKTPGVCGGDARIVRTRITVWFLEEMRRAGVSEAEILRRYPQLTATDLANAWAYVAARTTEIDALITDNEQAMVEPD
jgi:uncharacterized protein (DUF433 family)